MKLRLSSFIYTIIQRISWFVLYNGSRIVIRSRTRLRIEGMENLPAQGPILIAAHHFHHLHDGCIFISKLPRQTHIFVALDWIQSRWSRWLMETICMLVAWPFTLRAERLQEDMAPQTLPRQSAYALGEVKHYFLRAATQTVRLLRNSNLLVILPEAYPVVDPAFTPKTDANTFLPFQPGFIRLVELAERDKQTQVAIIPAGFTYQRAKKWQVTLRLGKALYRRDFASNAELVQVVEAQVHALSLASAENGLQAAMPPRNNGG